MNEYIAPRQAVAELAKLILNTGVSDAFRKRAAQLAKDFDEYDIEDLRFGLHYPPAEPDDYSFERHGLGGWLSACQFAAFELIYNMGATALPLVREIAWGEYDWTQGNAIELLIRFAADGLDQDAIIEEVKTGFPGIRYEAQLYTVEPLVGRLESEPALAAVFDRLCECKAFKAIIDEVKARR